MTRVLTDRKPDTGDRAVIAISDADRVAYIDGKPCRLTQQEYRLLLAFAQEPGLALSRDWLLCVAWDYESPGKTRTVDVHMQRLRRKMGGQLFETVHGVGYKFRAQNIG